MRIIGHAVISIDVILLYLDISRYMYTHASVQVLILFQIIADIDKSTDATLIVQNLVKTYL